MAEPGPDRCSTVLPETVQAVELGRRFAQGVLTDTGYRGRHDDILLIVSELVTNALRHGCGTPRLSVLCAEDGTRVRLEVADDSPDLPSPRASGPGGGFGLVVMGRLGQWGAEPRGTGKAVWCEVVAADIEAETADISAGPAGRITAPDMAVSP